MKIRKTGAVVSGALAAAIAATAGLGMMSMGKADDAAPGQQAGGGKPDFSMFSPEYQARIGQLQKGTLMEVQRLMGQHSRFSNSLTLRQVMQEILLDFQGAIAGVATHNGQLASDRARSLANHWIPKGGLIPYLRLDDLTDDKLLVLPQMNTIVEGGAKALADAAEAGDFAAAAGHLSEIMTACVQCHEIFRGVPGVSPALVKK